VELVENLRERVCLVSGGSSGIGLATARALRARGAKVITIARREVPESPHGDWLHIRGDIADPSTSSAAVEACLRAWGRLDAAVVNAGVGYFGGILDATDQHVTEMVTTNLLGSIWLVRAAVAQLRAQGGGGDVVLVSSAAGYRGEAFEAVYAATKHGQVGLAGSLDRELSAEGTRVTLICPAGVETEFAIGHGRVANDPSMVDYMRPEDVSDAIIAVLGQSRLIRTTTVQFRSIRQPS
jgi:3-oxoacyl-[acyl-carrier protein] reductase